MAYIQNYTISAKNNAFLEVVWKPEYIEKKKVPATIKTMDGHSLVGALHIRNCNITLQDELNSDIVENFIALTEIQDGNGGTLPITILLNYSKIVYVSVHQDSLTMPNFMNDKMGSYISRRKVNVLLRLEDGKNLTGNIHIRNTIKRTKDELNTSNSKFILLTDVQLARGQVSPYVYFVNKEHVIYFAVGDDSLQYSELLD